MVTNQQESIEKKQKNQDKAGNVFMTSAAAWETRKVFIYSPFQPPTLAEGNELARPIASITIPVVITSGNTIGSVGRPAGNMT